MLGLPLHPLVVHFPIVFSVLLPISVIVALVAIRKGMTPRRAWAIPLALAAALAVSAFVAVRTGEAQEDRVERVVGDAAIESHEEGAERFLALAVALLVVAGIGLAPAVTGRVARGVTAVGAVGLLVAGAMVGHSGGVLVYRDGAASAYARPAVGDRLSASPGEVRGVDDER